MESLLQIASIGILLSSFMVALNVLLLRYQAPTDDPFPDDFGKLNITLTS